MFTQNRWFIGKMDKMVNRFHCHKHDARHGRPQGLMLLNVLAAIMMFAMLCTGCGGSDSGSGTPAPSIGGVIADGYLEGVTVFLDLNNNRLRDAGEPYTTSGSDGSYTISDITAADYNSYPVVAEVTVSAIDQDTNKPVSHPYTLVAPAGHPEFVSPLTTMVQVSYESNPGITLDDAATAVKEMMNIDNTTEVDLFADYVAEKDDQDALAADYAKLHNVAQLTARIMGAKITSLETAADTAGIDLDAAKDEILRIAVKEIIQTMSVIEDAATDEIDFNADQVIQSLDVDTDTANIADIIEAEEESATYQAPAIYFAGFFRNNDAGGTVDYACLALMQDVDLTQYAFSFEAADGTVYPFEEADLYADPAAPIAWAKSFASLPEGQYAFYVTVPGGQKVKLATDTHVHTMVPAMSTGANYVVHADAPYSRVYHSTLSDNAHYYRMAIRESASGELVYRTKRRMRNIQYFPSEYATSGYEYRIEVWDEPIFKDATGRYRTGWTPLNPSDAPATDTFVYFYKGYRRILYESNGVDTTGSSHRMVLQIGITNPDNLQGLYVTDALDNVIYTYDLTLQSGDEVDNYPDNLFARGSGITDEENGALDYADYYLHIYGNPPSGVYTWHVDVIDGTDFTQSVTVYDQTTLPCVQPGTVTITEDQYGDITMDWDAVNWSGKPVFYRIAMYKDNLFDSGFFSMRIPNSIWTGNRADIEAAFGSSMDEGEITYAIWVIDAQYFSMVTNRSDHKHVPFTIN